MRGPQGWEFIIILVLVLVLFGGAKIPQLARNLGRAQKEFKDGIESGASEGSKESDNKESDNAV
ncbi:MAG: twin-arginine translocase TatA/TatE family subunit [Acidimicrobiia bacterium]|nr:twin-arginine translocase TatA/TatE family subunit [Acidimicrobiia bacterium]